MQGNTFLLAASRVGSKILEPATQEAAVRSAAGLPQVVTVADLTSALAGFESAESVVSELLSEVAEWAEVDEEAMLASAERFARVMEVHQFRIALENVSRGFGALRDKPGGRQWGFDLLAEPAEELIKTLANTVTSLPAGADALDAEANIDAGSTAELAEVRDILTRLGTMAGYLTTSTNLVAVVVDVPDVEIGTAERAGAPEQSPSAARAAVQAMRHDAEQSTDLILVDIARGDRPPLALRLADSPAQSVHRDEQLKNANRVQYVGAATSSRGVVQAVRVSGDRTSTY